MQEELITPDLLGRLVAEAKLEAIRAFVGRVGARIENALPFTDLVDLMFEELKATEAEHERRTNNPR